MCSDISLDNKESEIQQELHNHINCRSCSRILLIFLSNQLHPNRSLVFQHCWQSHIRHLHHSPTATHSAQSHCSSRHSGTATRVCCADLQRGSEGIVRVCCGRRGEGC
ncbi:hypothetical protein BLNAU_4385 [Blattamonas nauphoetae]|uniref:Uncharacterized protein n=1 Tax=Blattamonas nauphoetae TaxID=2049346 RepID=A0ABQ9YAE7_9EUKA|nr:hypothetical protein BLNAU_4385 [Blattamonas nauphoetae]